MFDCRYCMCFGVDVFLEPGLHDMQALFYNVIINAVHAFL